MVAEHLAEEIANAFSTILCDWLTAAELDTVNERNKTRGAGVCHSHDFCDANMAMAEAFETVVKRPVDPQSDADTALWDRAWDTARESGFVPSEYRCRYCGKVTDATCDCGCCDN